ncbi:MAG TPA: sensor domain-containing diguanylate cyclase [Solirubrobacterales bacterium]|jgi:diguanylate cyclase (GGDEF)-like protein|nr:sensor domain-containing diguanylate cyclase [Solirubrobacterales bacterium]
MEASRDRLMAIIKTQSEIAASDLDMNQVMHLVARRAQEITGATSAVIELPEGDEMVYAVTSGEATPYLGIRMDRRSTLSGLALDRDQVLYCEDTEIDPRVDRRASRRVNLRSMICVPLKHQANAVGVLKVYSPNPRHFGPADVETLNLLSEAISAHLAHAELFEVAAKEGRTDALTGLFNRRAYEERRVVEAARSARYGHPLALGLFDLDGFKSVNDRYGHPAGDEVLQGVAEVIGSSRLTDDAFRIGGDEFAVLMPQTTLDGGKIAAKRLAQALAGAQLGDGTVTASYGVAATVGDALSLHDAADRSLLAAKRKLRSPAA